MPSSSLERLERCAVAQDRPSMVPTESDLYGILSRSLPQNRKARRNGPEISLAEFYERLCWLNGDDRVQLARSERQRMSDMLSLRTTVNASRAARARMMREQKYAPLFGK